MPIQGEETETHQGPCNNKSNLNVQQLVINMCIVYIAVLRVYQFLNLFANYNDIIVDNKYLEFDTFLYYLIEHKF